MAARAAEHPAVAVAALEGVALGAAPLRSYVMTARASVKASRSAQARRVQQGPEAQAEWAGSTAP
jgi:hypothetical protein